MDMDSDVTPEAQGGHPLAEIQDVTASTVQTLRQHWIDTAEQVLSIAASNEGRAGLGRLLSLNEQQLETFLALVASAAGVETGALPPPLAGGARGLVLDPEQLNRFKPE